METVAPPDVDVSALKAEFAENLLEISQVVQAHCSFEGELFRAWVVVDRYNHNIRNDIFVMEKRLLAQYPSLDFDVYVIPKPEGQIDAMFEGIELAFQRAA